MLLGFGTRFWAAGLCEFGLRIRAIGLLSTGVCPAKEGRFGSGGLRPDNLYPDS